MEPPPERWRRISDPPKIAQLAIEWSHCGAACARLCPPAAPTVFSPSGRAVYTVLEINPSLPRPVCRVLRGAALLALLVLPALAASSPSRGPAAARLEKLRALELLEVPAPAKGPAAKPLGPLAPAVATVRLPGEFEPQHAILLGCHSMLLDAPELFTGIVAAAQPQLEIVALVRNVGEYQRAQKLLADANIPAARVHFAELPHDTMWTRDYGPMIVQRFDGQAIVLDADYSRQARPEDDALPKRLAAALHLRSAQVPLHLEGGNLLSNGRGLCVASRDLLYANQAAGRSEKEVRQLLREFYGASQVVFLEPLMGESTGHVDMFATFAAPDAIVVGAYDPQIDPANAAVLDRNAAQLSRVMTPQGRLRVARIAMPPNRDQTWRTYTNVVYANGALLLPTYGDLDAAGQAQAIATYRQLLPAWKIVPIDARRVSRLGGALHCVTMNLGVIQRLPKFPAPAQIEAPAFKELASRRSRAVRLTVASTRQAGVDAAGEKSAPLTQYVKRTSFPRRRESSGEHSRSGFPPARE